MKIPAALLLAGLATSVFARDIDYTKRSTKLKRFVEDVLYVVEAGDKELYSKRWLARPRLSIASSDPALKTFAETVFGEICKEAGLSTAGESTLSIFVGDSKALAKIAAAKDREINLGAGHNYWIWWNADRSISEAIVFLCNDRITGPAAQDAMIEDILGAFGFPGRSREFDDSRMSMKRDVVVALTPLDRRLIAFCYQHLPPGSRKAELRKLVDLHWGE